MEKVTIESIAHNGKYANIKLTDGREVSGNSESEPKFKDLKAGETVELEFKDWIKPGTDIKKIFASFPKATAAGDAKKFAPKDKSYDAAIAAAHATGQMLSLTKDAGKEKFDELFEHIHTKIMSKVTK